MSLPLSAFEANSRAPGVTWIAPFVKPIIAA
jgi:hypothetical protein